MKLPEIKIINEKNKILHKKASEVTFPLKNEDKTLIKDMLKYLEMSQIEKYSEKYKLRPGMGLAFPQIGKLMRIFVICNDSSNVRSGNIVVILLAIIVFPEPVVCQM